MNQLIDLLSHPIMISILIVATMLPIGLLFENLYLSGRIGLKGNQRLLQQVGGTCGFYAMAYVSLCLRNKSLSMIQEVCENIISKAFDEKCTYVGEIFTKDNFFKIWNKFYSKSESAADIAIRDLYIASENDIHAIEKDLELNKNGKCFYIIPSKAHIGRCPHYYVLWKEDDILVTWDGDSGKESCVLPKLINRQNEMYTEYNMTKYLKQHLPCYGMVKCQNRLRNKKLYLAIKKQENKIKAEYKARDLILPIDLKGYAFRFSIDD